MNEQIHTSRVWKDKLIEYIISHSVRSFQRSLWRWFGFIAARWLGKLLDRGCA